MGETLLVGGAFVLFFVFPKHPTHNWILVVGMVMVVYGLRMTRGVY
jgi:predicted signal transduction protein with EAL and GGDEF domain